MVEVSAQPSFPIYSILSIYLRLSQPHDLRGSLCSLTRYSLPSWVECIQFASFAEPSECRHPLGIEDRIID